MVKELKFKSKNYENLNYYVLYISGIESDLK